MNESMKRITAEVTAVIERSIREELLREREAKLVAELEAVRAEIGRLDGKQQVLSGVREPASVPVPATKPTLDTRPTRRGSAHRLLIDVLKNAKQPMRTKELTKALIRRGWKTARKDPSRTVDAALRNNPGDFRRIAPGEFELIR